MQMFYVELMRKCPLCEKNITNLVQLYLTKIRHDMPNIWIEHVFAVRGNDMTNWNDLIRMIYMFVADLCRCNS
jgi:hypothetical protein